MASLLKHAAALAAARPRLEMLLFTLGAEGAGGRCELFGIDVFGVREVTRRPPITRAPAQPGLDGMVSMRGTLMPVIDLARHAGLDPAGHAQVMIIAGRNARLVGLLVERVDVIRRVEWSAVQAPPGMIRSRARGLVSAVADLGDGNLVMMVDSEAILASACLGTVPGHSDKRVSGPVAGNPARAGFAPGA